MNWGARSTNRRLQRAQRRRQILVFQLRQGGVSLLSIPSHGRFRRQLFPPAPLPSRSVLRRSPAAAVSHLSSSNVGEVHGLALACSEEVGSNWVPPLLFRRAYPSRFHR